MSQNNLDSDYDEEDVNANNNVNKNKLNSNEHNIFDDQSEDEFHMEANRDGNKK